MAVLTRSQRDYALAVTLVSDVAREEPKVAEVYRGLCHEFPIMVRSAGLAQTAAYHCAKATGPDERARAHGLLLEHMALLLGATDLTEQARSMPTQEYMIATRRILTGAVFFKRLAVSLLDPDAAAAGVTTP